MSFIQLFGKTQSKAFKNSLYLLETISNIFNQLIILCLHETKLRRKTVLLINFVDNWLKEIDQFIQALSKLRDFIPRILNLVVRRYYIHIWCQTYMLV